MELKILDTDRFFTDSPNTGEADCICSRCYQQIEEEEIPLRVAIDSEVIYAKNEKTGRESKKVIHVANGHEFRLCEDCQRGIGLKGI